MKEVKNKKKNEEEVKGPELEELDVFEELEETPKKLSKSNKIKIIVSISAIIIIILLYIFLPKIKLNGSSDIKISYNEAYQEKGATAKFLGKDISSNIKIKGKVNTKKVGRYKIIYMVKKSFMTVKKVRIVSVVDEKEPTIRLTGDKKLSICPDGEYKELGFKAFDEYDGDLTKKVKIEEKEDKIIYTVSDSSNNTYKITRKLIREDKESPVITLNGDSTTYVIVNTEFKEPGFTAIDNCDGDITDKVSIDGSIDTTTVGEYELKYSVTDKHNNISTVTRKVIVQINAPKRSANLGCGEAGVIYLTFDDGPNNSTTTQILNVLKKYNVKATFFVTNTNGGSDSQIKREHDEGHLVALHTSTHNYSKIYASDEAYFSDLKAISDRVERITGIKSYFLRFPGGSSNTVSRHYSSGIMSRLAYTVESRGYAYYDWNIDSRDAEGKKCNEVYSNVVNGLSKSYGNVILMHDIKESTACAIEDIIKYGLDNGYTFKVLDKSITCHHKTAN